MPPAAFKKKMKEDPYALHDDTPKWATRTEDNVSGTWATYDAELGSFQYDRRYEEGHTESKIFEDEKWLGNKADGETDVEVFKKKFIDDDAIMDDRIAKTDFEVRNAGFLGLGDDPDKRRVINNQIGNSYVQIKQRTYGLPGKSKNNQSSEWVIQPTKKSLTEEMARRIAERNKEMTERFAQFRQWQAMSAEERKKLYEEKRNKDRQLMETVTFTAVERVPDEVQGLGIDLQNLNFDEDTPTETVTETASSPLQARSRRRNERSRSPSSRSISSFSGRPYRSGHASPAMHSNSSRNRPSTPSIFSPLNDSLATPISYTLPARSRTRSYTPSIRSTATQPKPPPPLRIFYHPRLLPPPEDLEHFGGEEANADLMYEAKLQKLQRVYDLNAKRPRVVTIRLDPKVTTPFPEAITDRLWGGMIQQLIFDPSSKHAVAIFVTASGASAFVQHWRGIEAFGGDMEMRRLQIAVDWYGASTADDQTSSSKAIDSARTSRLSATDTISTEAILPVQENVLHAICFAGATRVLIVSNILSRINKNDAEAGFRRCVGLDRVICRGRLVVPTKQYEMRKPDPHNNQLVVEFASVRDAVDVRDDINAERLGPDWRGCRAEFMRDPVDMPPVAREYCKCRWCRKSRNE